MATTSLWHIEGRLKDLISYVENPEKTVAKDKDLQDFYNVFSYVSRPEATENGEYVSAINCLKEIALQQMILTKKQYGKDDGYIAWHGYQSFKPGEVTPEQAHEIGLQLAKEMWGEQYQIIVTTHLDKDHLHNHFCFNSVSFLDGRKYNYSKTEQRKLREASDRICREHGLSVIEKPHKAPSRQVWLDEKSGRPTRYNVYREDVKEAVLLCMRAGIRPIMITGDHLTTATAIAKQTGILKKGSIALTGSDLDAMDDKELKTAVKKCCVFARVTPEHKMRIVKALQRCGEVVAMTGDGVNDAPALKAADIGCAMGKIGTEVAKSAADMVLTDDNFSTIVSAVKEGRGIYDNIRKAVHFLLSCNIGEILTIFAASLFNLPTPLFAIQLLWVNLVTDSLPAIALGLEPVEPDVMYRKPVRKDQSLFHGGLFWDILLQGCMIGAFTLLGFTLGNVFYSLETGRTIAFAVLSLSQLVHAFNVRSRHSVFDIGLFSNKVMCLSFVVCAALQISVITIPALAGVFKTVPLDSLQWMLVVLLSALPLAIMEFVKGMRD